MTPNDLPQEQPIRGPGDESKFDRVIKRPSRPASQCADDSFGTNSSDLPGRLPMGPKPTVKGTAESGKNGKLYASGLFSLLGLSAVVVVVSVFVTAHDALQYRALPERYRLAIEGLQDGWHYSRLPASQRQAVLDQHQKWAEQGKFALWAAGEAIDPNFQKAVTLDNFEKFVPRWGFRMNQQQPLLAVAISLIAFVPAVVFAGTAKWVRWLQSPTL